MARTITEIENEILIAKNSNATLQTIDTNSRFSVWGAIVYVVAFVIHTLERLFDLHKQEIQETITQAIPGNADWFIIKAKEFQYGDNLVLNSDFVPDYKAINEEKKIVKYAAINTSANGQVILKVATEDAQNNIVPLSGNELTALRHYIDRLMPVGTSLLVNSLSTDYLKLEADIYYNPLINISITQDLVYAAVANYLKQLPFDGRVLVSKLMDAIQQVEGVEDIYIAQVQGRMNSGGFVSFERIYFTEAGYVQVDPNEPLESTLIFKAN